MMYSPSRRLQIYHPGSSSVTRMTMVLDSLVQLEVRSRSVIVRNRIRRVEYDRRSVVTYTHVKLPVQSKTRAHRSLRPIDPF
jgi:hypothetical protein